MPGADEGPRPHPNFHTIEHNNPPSPGGNTVTWSEAYSRAAKAALAIVVVYLIGVVVGGVGGSLIATENWAAVIVGGIFVLVGILGVIIGLMAIWIKVITESIIDNVKTDLSQQIKDLAEANRSTETPTPENTDTDPAHQIEKPAD